MYNDLDLLDILKENGYKQTTKNLLILKEGLENGSYIIEDEIMFDESFLYEAVENITKDDLLEGFKKAYVTSLNLLEMNDNDFDNYISNCSDSELNEAIALISESFSDINEQISTLNESTTNILENYFNDSYNYLLESKKNKAFKVAAYAAPAVGAAAGIGAKHLAGKGIKTAVLGAAGNAAKAVGLGGAVGLGAGLAATGAYHIAKRIKKIKDARRNYSKTIEGKDDTEKKNLKDYTDNRSARQAGKRAKRLAKAKWEKENRGNINNSLKDLKNKKKKGEIADNDYDAKMAAIKKKKTEKNEVANAARDSAKESYKQGKRIMKVKAAEDDISTTSTKQLNKKASERSKSTVTESYSDYELYKLLESSGYKTTNKNLLILKEGLELGTYIIVD